MKCQELGPEVEFLYLLREYSLVKIRTTKDINVMSG